jgi:hypothetical protein
MLRAFLYFILVISLIGKTDKEEKTNESKSRRKKSRATESKKEFNCKTS